MHTKATETSYAADTAIVIGRWQIVHNAHVRMYKHAFTVARQVIIFIGSAYRARDPRNPFKWTERRDMILSTLTEDEKSRVIFVPVRDYFDNDRWNDFVHAAVARHTHQGDRITLVGWKKDATTDYLDDFPAWKATTVQATCDTSGTGMRDLYFGSADVKSALTIMSDYVPASVVAYLEAWSHLPVYKDRVAEHKAVETYKAKWGPGPFLTADAIVTLKVNGRRMVLLGRRKGPIGKDLWAIPGGHVEKGEQFYAAAIRELSEETAFSLMPVTMQGALAETVLLDHPQRSPRARVVSMAHVFDFGDMECPDLHPGDDIVEPRLVDIEDLPQFEELLFEDHAVVLDRVFHFFPTADNLREDPPEYPVGFVGSMAPARAA